MGLFAFLRPDRQRLDHLERRVETLVAGEEAREVAYLAIADQVKRYLARAAVYDSRLKAREEHGADPVTMAVLRSKFPPASNGG